MSDSEKGILYGMKREESKRLVGWTLLYNLLPGIIKYICWSLSFKTVVFGMFSNNILLSKWYVLV